MSIVCLLSWMGLILSASDTPVQPVQPTDSYGCAVVSHVLRIDPACTIYCDIADFPPIIGENMPVKICGLKTADTVEYNQKIQTFLVDLLLTKTDSPKKVQLNHIRRGNSFCLLADVEIDGQDVCDLLVENGLAKRVIQVKEPAAPPAALTRPASQVAPPRTQQNAYVASKTSKIFHRVGCAHAKRIDPDKAVYFSSRREAEQAGRQPCKTCSP